jgi:transposase-like protein
MSLYTDLESAAVSIIIAIAPAKYLGLTDDRMLFRYDNSEKTMAFPPPDYLSEHEYRFNFERKQQLDELIDIWKIKFSNTHWSVSAYGYTRTGAMQRIANI